MPTSNPRLWSIQRYELWEKLTEQKTLRVDVSKSVCFTFWPDSYNWMRNQMGKRVPGYEGGFPWWAWFGKKPDLRRWRHTLGGSGDRFVRMELDIPPSQVLLPSYYAWNYVIMYDYVPFTIEEAKEWERELQAQGIRFNARRIPEPWKSRRQASWERIFDLERLEQGDYWYQKVTQATFEVLSLTHVVSAESFKAAKSK